MIYKACSVEQEKIINCNITLSYCDMCPDSHQNTYTNKVQGLVFKFYSLHVVLEIYHQDFDVAIELVKIPFIWRLVSPQMCFKCKHDE